LGLLKLILSLKLWRIIHNEFLLTLKLVQIKLLKVLVMCLILIENLLILQLRNLLLALQDLDINWNNKLIEIQIVWVFFILYFLIVMILEKLIGIWWNWNFESLYIKFLKSSEFKLLMSRIINASNYLFKHFFFHHSIHYKQSKFIDIFKIFSLTKRNRIISSFFEKFNYALKISYDIINFLRFKLLTVWILISKHFDISESLLQSQCVIMLQINIKILEKHLFVY